jgi:hypothetical protein
MSLNPSARRLCALIMTSFWLLAGCGAEVVEDPQPSAPTNKAVTEDLDPTLGGKSDGLGFNRHNIISDNALTDVTYVTAQTLQKFFEKTPYNRRSFLADYVVEGVPASEFLVGIAEEYSLNPLVLAVRMQIESGLIYSTERPDDYVLAKAMGCGCLDGQSCLASLTGFAKQIRCAADLLRNYLIQLDQLGVTVSGWSVGHSKQALDGKIVTPANRATAALYTYTPWVLTGIGGNWLVWNVYRRYSSHILKQHPNHHWIGGECAGPQECAYDDAECLGDIDGGMCSMRCEGLCPDGDSAYTSPTFCVDMGPFISTEEAGYCVSQCDDSLYPENGGCRPGFYCSYRERYGEPPTSRYVCVPVLE